MLESKIFNHRVSILIERFFTEELKQIYGRQGWFLPPCHRKMDMWSNGHFSVRVTGYHQDRAVEKLEYSMYNVPSYTAKERVGFKHKFSIQLPRKYPDDLNEIKLQNLTPFYHPRISEGATNSKPCVFIKGDLDSILSYLIQFTLLKPDVVLPTGADNGLNHQATEWYKSRGLDKVYIYLFALWNQQQEKVEITVPKVRIRSSKKL